MGFDEAIIGAFVEHDKFGKGIVLSHDVRRLRENLVNIYWLEALGDWRQTTEKYWRMGDKYIFESNYFGEIKILSMPNFTNSNKTFE